MKCAVVSLWDCSVCVFITAVLLCSRCVFITAVPITKLFTGERGGEGYCVKGGGEEEGERERELLQSGSREGVCVFYYCRTYYKAVRVCVGGGTMEDMCYEGLRAEACGD